MRGPRLDGIPKSFFVGDPDDPSDDPTFYLRMSLSNEPALSVTPGSAAPLLRVKWEITEDILFARNASPGVDNGKLVAAFPIHEHFDAVATDSFGLWSDQSMMKVGFERNLITEAYDKLGDLAFVGTGSAISFEPLSFYATGDDTLVDSPQILLDQGYIGVTNVVLATPTLFDTGTGLVSTPSWLTSGVLAVNPDELRLRLSFLRIDDDGYTPLPWDDARDQAAGAGSVVVPGATGELDARRRTRADITSPIVWHYTRASDPALFESTREAVSAWDVAMRAAERSAQYADCGAAGGTIGECSKDHPVPRNHIELEDAVALANELDQCLRSGSGWGAPQSLERQDDCLATAASTGEARGISSAAVSIATAPAKMLLCNAPVSVYDDPRCIADHQKRLSDSRRAEDDRRPIELPLTTTDCAEAWAEPFVDTDITQACNAGFYVDPGDLRFFTITVSEHLGTSSWSTMSRAADPSTGEIVSADIRIWADPTRSAAARAALRLVPDAADPLDAYFLALGGDALAALRFDPASRDRRALALADGRSLDEPVASPSVGFDELPAESRAAAVEALRSLAGARASAAEVASDVALFEGRVLSGRDTQTEARSLTAPVLRASGFTEADIATATAGLGGGFTNGGYDYASFFRLGDPRTRLALLQRVEVARAERGASVLDASDALPSPRSLALLRPLVEEALGPPPESGSARDLYRAEVSRLLTARVHRQLTLHQMGRALGLSSNYGGSADALGYRLQYWQLRTRNGDVTAACADGVEPASCVGPRSIDAPTKEERAQLSDSLFAQSSVMDTPGDPLDAFATLGSYDLEALRLLYFDVASVGLGFDLESGAPLAEGTLSDPAATLLLDLHGRAGALGLRSIDASGRSLSYADLGPALGLVRDCREVDVEAFRPESANVAWHPLLDGGLVAIDGVPTRCAGRPVDFVQLSSLQPATPAEASGTTGYAGAPAIDPLGRVRVATVYGGELAVDQGNALIWRGDRGADRWEIVAQRIVDHDARARFQSQWLTEEGAEPVAFERAAWRLHLQDAPLRGAAVGLGAMRARLEASVASEPGAVGAALRALAPDDVEAAGIAFDDLARRLFQPLSGSHVAEESWSSPAGSPSALTWETPFLRGADYAQGQTSPKLSLPTGLVQFSTGITWGGGGALVDPLAVGFEKAYAAGSLWERSDPLVDGDGERLEPVPVALSDAFPEAARRVLAAGLTGDYSGMPRVASASGAPLLSKSGALRMGVGRTSWTTETPELCFPASGRMSCSSYGCDDACKTDQAALPPLFPDFTGAPEADVLLQSFDDEDTYRTLLAASLLRVPLESPEGWAEQLELGPWDGVSALPSNRIELHAQDGTIWLARTYGTEVLFGARVQRGVAARVLEQANDFARAAFHCNEVTAETGSGSWCVPELVGDQWRVRFDPHTFGGPDCTAADDTGCTCEDNRACVAFTAATRRAGALHRARVDLGFADD